MLALTLHYTINIHEHVGVLTLAFSCAKLELCRPANMAAQSGACRSKLTHHKVQFGPPDVSNVTKGTVAGVPDSKEMLNPK